MDKIIKLYYEKGLYTAEDLAVFAQAGYISEQEMKEMLENEERIDNHE